MKDGLIDGIRIKDEISQRQLTITDFARNARVSVATIHRVLRGGGRANTKTLGKIAAALSVDKPSDLLQPNPSKGMTA